MEPVYQGPDCSYTLRSRKTAFVLSFLLGTWGAGRLYLGLIGTGILQLVGFTMLLALPCFPLCCMCVTSDSAKLKRYYRAIVVLSIFGMTAILIWWISDWLTILLNIRDAYDNNLTDDLKKRFVNSVQIKL
jgi:hypothetical protein